MSARLALPPASNILPGTVVDLSLDARWLATFGTEPPRSASLIEQAVAWREQMLRHGDVMPNVQRDLAGAAEQARVARGAERAMSSIASTASRPISDDRAKTATLPDKLTPGTRLVKAHGGRNHVVEVTAAGMLYDGQLFASLSAVAKAITGTHWNGLLFFGLRKRKVYPVKAAARG